VEDDCEDEASRRAAKLKTLRDDWERSTNRKLQANAVRRQVQGILAENEMALEARRARYVAGQLSLLPSVLTLTGYWLRFCIPLDTM